MMKKTLAAVALAALIATPAFAQSMTSDSRAAAVKSYASDTSKAKAKKKSATIVGRAQPRSASPYSTNPEYDVYFRGEYVGSDPDPRVRWTLRDEARRSYGINN